MQRWVSALALLTIVWGCDRSTSERKAPAELETVEVGEGLDAELSTELDQRGRQFEVELGGVLPADFPPEMPVFSPASVVDFGPGFVELDTAVPVEEVRTALGGRIRQAGWTVESIGGGGSVYSRAGFRVRVLVEKAGTGARVRYEY